MMDAMTNMFLIAGIVLVIVTLIGWEVSGRWKYLTSKTARRLQDADSVDYLEGLTDPSVRSGQGFSKDSLAHKLVEANINLSPTQLYLAAVGLSVAGTLLSWAFFVPGLPALAIGGILGYLPFAYVNDRARRLGREIDKKLPIALSRIAPGLQVNRGLDDVLEEVARSLQAEGPCPLSAELLRTAKDIRTRTTEMALRNLAKRSPSLSLSNVAMLLESYHRAGGGQYADVISETATSIQRIIAVRSHAQAKAAQPLQSAKLIPVILGFVLFVMMNDPLTRTTFREPLVQIAMAVAMGIMLAGYLYMRSEVMKAV